MVWIILSLYGKPVRGYPAEQAAFLISVLFMAVMLLVGMTPVGEWLRRW